MRTRKFAVLALAMVLVGSSVWAHDNCPWNNVHRGCGQPGHIHLENMERKATLMNLSPWQAWIHLYCQEEDVDDSGKCHVAFRCNGMEGKSVSWTVEVDQYRIFSYWPAKTESDGTSANLQAALMEAGKMEDEARRRTTCEVFSDDEIAVRGYTLFSGQPTLVPVAVY